MQINNSIERVSLIFRSQQRLRLSFRLILVFSAVITALIITLLPVQFLHNGSLTANASPKLDSNPDNLISETGLHQIPRSDFLQRSYSTATVLLEDVGGNTVELSSVLDGLGYFSILKEGDTYYLWLNSSKLEPLPYQGIEQRLESQDGLVWRNRTDTDLAIRNDDSYKFLAGLGSVIKKDNIYEGWEVYHYEWSLGWAYAVRYVTSTNGINWTVVNEPSQIGAAHPNVIEAGGIYHSWTRVDVDRRLYPNEREFVRYRTSNKGGSGWSHWQTGGDLVTVDGEALGGISYVRPSRDGVTYELFYITGDQMHLATSDNGSTFTTQMTNILDFAVLVPDKQRLDNFKVIEVEGVDWFYFVYQGQDDVYRLAASRPDAPSSTGSLTIIKEATPADGTDFTFNSNIPGYDSFTLDDETTQTDTISQTITFNDLVTGTYTITEILPADWQLDSATCTGGSDPGSLTNETLSVALDVGEDVVCTFTNSLIPDTTLIDGLLDLESTQTNYNPSPAPNAPQGIFSLSATFRNVSTTTIKYIHFEVAQLTNNNLLLNADADPAGPGAIISVPSAFLGADKELSPDETFTIIYQIGLASTSQFDFFVDAYGLVSDEVVSLSPPPEDDNLDFEIEEEQIQVTFNYRSYIPLITK